MKQYFLIATMFCAILTSQAQYESFFGDSTWEIHVTYLTNPPEDYIEYPPEVLNPLNVYCRTYKYLYEKNAINDETHQYYPLNSPYPRPKVCEDTVLGRLYVNREERDEDSTNVLLCDMSLSEGDTFVLKDLCWYDAYIYFPWNPAWLYDTVGDRNMIVDSVRYIAGRKTIFLSLIDHLDDYFFGSEYSHQHPDYQFTIRFIEGIGATYGLFPGCRYPSYVTDLYPSLGLMLCMYKDDNLVYMADETLGCDQTCVGISGYSQVNLNLYPNPATQYVILDMSTEEELDGMAVISDMLGRVCYQQKVQGNRICISVSDMPTGIYFLTYSDGKSSVTKKFLKE